MNTRIRNAWWKAIDALESFRDVTGCRLRFVFAFVAVAAVAVLA